MSSWPPAIADFKAQFNRGIPYGDGLDSVQNADITNALNAANVVFDTTLWTNPVEQQTAYLYAAAHFLVLNIQASGGLAAINQGRGIDSQGGGVIESKSVGGVSVGYALPDFVRQNPFLGQFMRTGYGQLFLAMVLPRMVGNVAVVSGDPRYSLTGASNIGPNGGTGYGGTTVALLQITTASLPSGTHAVAYNQTLTATGGVAPLAWSVTGGTLPTGLTLSQRGVLSGTPSAAATYYFTAMVTDARGATASMNYQVVIA